MDFPSCYALLLVIHSAPLIFQVESFTIQSTDSRDNRALRRHDYQLSDFKHDTFYPGGKTAQRVLKENHSNLNIKTNKCKNGARSSTNCILTETKNEEIHTKANSKNRDAARMKDKHISNNIPTLPNVELLSEETVNKIESPATTGIKNCTDVLLDENRNDHLNTSKLKMIPMLDALRKMLVALDNLLALAVNNTANATKSNGDQTVTNTKNTFTETKVATQPLEVIITPKTHIIYGNIIQTDSKTNVPMKSVVEDNVEIKDNEKTISSTSDMIDEAIEDLVKTGMVATFGEQLKSPSVDADSKKLLSAIEETENTRLYKWCVRLIREDKSDDKKKLKSVLKSKEMKKIFESLHTDKTDFKTKPNNNEANMSIFINSVLDCIGFVNTMQNIYHPRK